MSDYKINPRTGKFDMVGTASGTPGNGSEYVLPPATKNTMGGVKIGSRLSVTSDGIVSANPQAWTEITGKPSFAAVATSGSYNDLKDKPANTSAYILPTATPASLGGVKIGSRLSVTSDGTVSANPQAWTDITGKPSFATVATSGSYNDLKDKPANTSAYILPTATPASLGGVKIGSRLSVTSDGTVSANPQVWTDITGKPSFATVATSGSYNDLKDKPTIPDGGLQVTSGIWSPSASGVSASSLAASFSSSRWMAIGNMVHISTTLVMSASGTGVILITGLPFEVSVNTGWNVSVNRVGATSIQVAASIDQVAIGGAAIQTVLSLTNHSYNSQGSYYISGFYIKK